MFKGTHRKGTIRYVYYLWRIGCVYNMHLSYDRMCASLPVHTVYEFPIIIVYKQTHLSWEGLTYKRNGGVTKNAYKDYYDVNHIL